MGLWKGLQREAPINIQTNQGILNRQIRFIQTNILEISKKIKIFAGSITEQ